MITVSNEKHWLIEQATKYKNSVYALDKFARLTYSQLFEKSSHFAQSLIDLGVKKNDHLGILCPNNVEFFIAINALWFIGAIPIPLNIRNTEKEIESQIESADIKILLIHKEFTNQFLFNKLADTYYFPFDLSSKSPINFEPFILSNTALILFTSGSSGNAKAVVLSFSNLIASVKATDSLFKLNEKDVWLASLPFYHIGGFIIFCRSLLTGSTVIFPSSLKYEDLTFAMQLWEPSHISLVLTTLKRLIEENVEPNQNLKCLFLGGGPINTDLCIKAMNHGFPIVKVYGSTETTSMVTALTKEDLTNHPDSAGKSLNDNTIKIVSESNEQIGAGAFGEIAVKSKSVMIRYYKNEIETQNKLRDGFYFTGDYGWIDEEGFLYVESRREDLIVTGGENVSPHEIETTIKKLDCIKDVYVFPQQDSQWGQLVCSVITLKENEIISEDALIQFLKHSLASYKIPKKIFFVAHIPRNELGKVEKDKLKNILNLDES